MVFFEPLDTSELEDLRLAVEFGPRVEPTGRSGRVVFLSITLLLRLEAFGVSLVTIRGADEVATERVDVTDVVDTPREVGAGIRDLGSGMPEDGFGIPDGRLDASAISNSLSFSLAIQQLWRNVTQHNTTQASVDVPVWFSSNEFDIFNKSDSFPTA